MLRFHNITNCLVYVMNFLVCYVVLIRHFFYYVKNFIEIVIKFIDTFSTVGNFLVGRFS